MGFPGHILPLRRPWLELCEEPLLPLYPRCVLSHLLQHLLKRCVPRGDDLDLGRGFNLGQNLDGVTGRDRASKPLARFGAIEWRARSRLYESLAVVPQN